MNLRRSWNDSYTFFFDVDVPFRFGEGRQIGIVEAVWACDDAELDQGEQDVEIFHEDVETFDRFLKYTKPTVRGLSSR